MERIHDGTMRFGDAWLRLEVFRWAHVADSDTPVAVFDRLGADACFLLESAERNARVGRFSFVGGAPLASVTTDRAGTSIALAGRPGATLEVPNRDALAVLEEMVGGERGGEASGGFIGGFCGYLGFDYVKIVEPRAAVRPPSGVLAHFVMPSYLVRFDHHTGQADVFVTVLSDADRPRAAAEREALERYRKLVAALASGRARGLTGLDELRPHGFGRVESTFTRAGFVAAVERALEHIRAGDIFQVVLSQRFSFPRFTTPFALYRMLRFANPSPFMFLFRGAHATLVGASPEPLVRVFGTRVAQRPIAGTRPRGRSAAEDAALAAELLADEKECAEHAMLVDLARNDLGRVCAPGSVEVAERMTVEKYSHVMHIVSEVTGELGASRSPLDALRASFPAGTVSGAPKIRALQIIDELEPTPRGPYAGAFGYLSLTGDLDTCITIRTAVATERTFEVQAGAGIVADSDPEREYEETVAKARGLLSLLEEGVVDRAALAR